MSPVDLERVCCNLCQKSTAEETLFVLNKTAFGRPLRFPVVRCCNCGLAYINPRPTPASMAQFYDGSVICAQLEVADAEHLSGLRALLVSKITKSVVTKRLRSLARVVPLNQQTRILDMGCGKGGFLHEAKARFASAVYGLELDPACVSVCREKLNLPVFRGLLVSIPTTFDPSGLKFLTSIDPPAPGVSQEH